MRWIKDLDRYMYVCTYVTIVKPLVYVNQVTYVRRKEKLDTRVHYLHIWWDLIATSNERKIYEQKANVEQLFEFVYTKCIRKIKLRCFSSGLSMITAMRVYIFTMCMYVYMYETNINVSAYCLYGNWSFWLRSRWLH